jgi:hypothetical protein
MFCQSSLAHTSKGYAFVHIEVRQDRVVINLDQVETFFFDEGLQPYYLNARVKSRKAMFNI